MEEKTQPKTILITGATDGLGLALGKFYMDHHYQVIMIGRKSLSKLDKEFFNEHNYCQANLTLPKSATRIREFLDVKKIDGLDLLIHNAAIGHHGLFDESHAMIENLILVNLLAPIKLTHVLIPYLRKRRGKVAFITSYSARFAAPYSAIYTATKAALNNFARSLAIEWQHEIPVVVIQLGALNTDFYKKAGMSQNQISLDQTSATAHIAAKIFQTIKHCHGIHCIELTSRIQSLWYYLFPSAISSKHNQQLIAAGLIADMERRYHYAPMPPMVTPGSSISICVITGAASGLGQALAIRFARAGYAIIGVDDNRENANKTKKIISDMGGNVSFLISDLSTTEGIETILNQLKLLRQISIVIHNAAINKTGLFTTCDSESQGHIITMNLLAPLQITNAIIRRHQLKADGAFVFISSLSHFLSSPGDSVGAASNSGLASFADSLRLAMTGKHHVLTVFPGLNHARLTHSHNPDIKPPNDTIDGYSESLAAMIFDSLQKKRPILIPGLMNRFFAAVSPYFPALTEKILKKRMVEH